MTFTAVSNFHRTISATGSSVRLPDAERVCMTVSAQWPILSRFDTLRRRSVRVGTRRQVTHEGQRNRRRDLRTGYPGHTPVPGSRASWRRPRRARRRVLVFDVLDLRIGERELVDDHAHGLAEARVVGMFIEDRRLDDQRLLICQSRPTSVDVATPGFRGEIVRKPGVHTRSSHPFSIAGKLRKCTGATNASASARATFCCCTSTSFG